MKKIIILILLLAASIIAPAQIIQSGTILYKKVTNLHLTMKLEYADQFGSHAGFSLEDLLKMIPKNITQDCVMTFNTQKSMYRFDKDGPEKMPSWGGKDPASENIVYKNFANNKYSAQKDILEASYIIEDSISNFKWKIHDEIRVIAGFTCRKATTTVNDSIVVVAFYTDEIAVSSGPESFGGLPGMILGLAIPRLYTTWFAYEFKYGEYDTTLEKEFSKKRTKNVTYKEMYNELEKSLSQWGKFGEGILIKSII